MLIETIELPQAILYLATLTALGALLYGEVKLIQGTVQFLKTALKWDGNRVTIMSFVVGVIYGGLLYGLAWENLKDYPLYVQIILGILYILMAGLYASGFYEMRDSVMARRKTE